jgi:hypothetical protein
LPDVLCFVEAQDYLLGHEHFLSSVQEKGSAPLPRVPPLWRRACVLGGGRSPCATSEHSNHVRRYPESVEVWSKSFRI